MTPPPGARGLVAPCLAVLPMGWSWSLSICQEDLIKAIREAGFKSHEIMAGRSPAPRIGEDCSRVLMAYVDNFGLTAATAQEAKAGAESIRDILLAKGLCVHEV